jgi:Tol biopolymer transport system component
MLPGGRAVVFTSRAPTLNSYENAAVDVFSLATKARKTLWTGGYFGRYVASRGTKGHLLYIHEGVLFAAPFDPERLELEGTPSAVVEGIASDSASGGGQFDVSANGTMVYLEGPGTQSWSMVTIDASGKADAILQKPGMYYSPRFSPDGGRLAFAIESGNGSDVFVYNFVSQLNTRLSFTPGQGNIEPIWTPDGKHIAYRSLRPPALWWVRADGGGEPQRLYLSSSLGIQATSFSPDGTRLAYNQDADVLILPLDLTDPERPKPGSPERLLSTQVNEALAAFSPDGQWIAYTSDESGRQEVYVRRTSETAGKWQVSGDGGYLPIWSHDRREIFYLSPGNRIMATEYEVRGDSFVVRKPRQWSSTQILGPGYTQFDLAPDGKRVVGLLDLAPAPEKTENVHVTFLLNFFDELRRRAPGK